MGSSTGRAGPSLPMGYRQGKVLQWNPLTLENLVRVGNTTLENLPVLGVGEAASIRVGAVVGLADVGATTAILGRFVIPGTDDAKDAITQLGQRFTSVNDEEAGTRTAAGFGPLDPPARPGPERQVLVGASGQALIMLTAFVEVDLSGIVGTTSQTGIVSVQVTGATEVSPEIMRSKYLRYRGVNDDEVSDVTDRSTALVLLEGLNPGMHSFTMVYSSADSQDPDLVFFSERNLTVVAL